jgi:hypothetical protein
VKIVYFTKQQHNMISEIDTNLQIDRKINNQTNNLQTSIHLYANKIKGVIVTCFNDCLECNGIAC